MSNDQILLHPEPLTKLCAKRQALTCGGESLAGGRLQARQFGDDPASMSDAQLSERLFAPISR
jgi:hypothetical protein